MTITSLPTLNATLLFDLIRWAEHDDTIDKSWGTWDQSSWGWVKATALTDGQVKEARNGACQTAYCMAGQAAHQAGYRLLYNEGDRITRDIEMFDGHHFDGLSITASECVQQRPTDRRTPRGAVIWEDVPGATEEQISTVGAEVLGLTDEEAERFFEGDNDLPELRAMANRFCDDRGLPLLFPYDPTWSGEYEYDDEDF